jgi:hypothetical protein
MKYDTLYFIVHIKFRISNHAYTAKEHSNCQLFMRNDY